MRKRPSHATAMSKELTPVHTKEGKKSRWSGGSANSKSSLCTTIFQTVHDYFQFFVFMIFALIALYYAGSFFKVKSYSFHTLILYQHENQNSMDRSDGFLHTNHNQGSQVKVEGSLSHSDLIGPKVLDLNDGTICITSNYPSKPFLGIINLTSSFINPVHGHNQKLVRKMELSYSNIRVAGGITGRIPIQISLYKEEIILVLLRNGLLVAYSKNGLKMLWSIVVYGKGLVASKSSNQQQRDNEEVPSIDTDTGQQQSQQNFDSMLLKPSNTALFVHSNDSFLYVLLNNEIVTKINVNTGKVVWKYSMNGRADSMELGEISVDDDDEEAVYPVNAYKLGNDGGRKKDKMKPWYSFRNSILSSLPHSPHHLPSIRLQHFKLDSHNVNHGKMKQQGNTRVKQPNAVCVYNRRGIFVLHKETGKALTEIVLPEPRHGSNDGSRGIYIASPLKTNTIFHLEGLAGERDEPIPIPECFARVTEGIPPTNAHWNANICMKHENPKTTYIATPILVRGIRTSKDLSSDEMHSDVGVLYFTSGGTVTMLDSMTGKVMFQVQTKATWSGSGGGKTLHHLNAVGIDEMANSGLKYVYPHCFVVDDFSGSGKGSGMVGCIGDSYVVVFDFNGNILGSMYLIEPPLNEVTVVKMHHVGSEITGRKTSAADSADYVIITSTWEGIIGYRLQHSIKLHESSPLWIAMIIFFVLIGILLYCVMTMDDYY